MGKNIGVTRRGFLRAAGAAWVALAGAWACEPAEGGGQKNKGEATPRDPRGGTSVRGLPSARRGPTWVFRSRPDLAPPVVTVDTRREGLAPGHVFLAPKKGPGRDGTMILDNNGDPVWFRPMQGEARDAMDCKVQSYRGKPVLTWWEGVHGGYGQGEYVICDGRYREVARVRAGNNLDGDHHEFLITKRDTALITAYAEVPYDLSPFGGPRDGAVVEGVVQEIKIATGEILFEWQSLEHVGVGETHGDLPEDPTVPFDYFHINSVDVDADDNLLVSARRTFAVYKIDRQSGEVVWRLGGKKSSFKMGEGTKTLYQHDARRQPDNTITLFDNGGQFKSERSRIVAIKADEETMTATLVREQAHPDGLLSLTQGNAQKLPNNNTFVGWGSEPVFSEFSPGGVLLFNASLPADVESYRAFRHPWTGRPETSPDLAVVPDPEGGFFLYASWNGATEVAGWQVLAGPAADKMEPAGSVPHTGFETAIGVRTREPVLGVRAVDAAGQVLSASGVVDVRA